MALRIIQWGTGAVGREALATILDPRSGLELVGVIEEVRDNHEGVSRAFWIAALAIVATLLVRAAFVAPLVWGIHRRAMRAEKIQPRIAAFQRKVEAVPETAAIPHPPKQSISWFRRLRTLRFRRASRDQMRTRLTKLDADISHMLDQPLGWREGTVIVWAGMRGVVTIAAAQTLPGDTPSRALLVLIAFLVAVGSLLVQGGFIGPVLRWVKPAQGPTDEELSEERGRLSGLLVEATSDLRAELEEKFDLGKDAEPSERFAAGLALVKARREALLDIRDLGTYSAAALEEELRRLDADQIRLELQA